MIRLLAVALGLIPWLTLAGFAAKSGGAGGKPAKPPKPAAVAEAAQPPAGSRPQTGDLAVADNRRFRWEQVENESLALIGPYGVIWRLNFGAKERKPHFHPLQTVDGRCLTWQSPPDHVWHYGLWHSWKFIDAENYWEEDRKNRGGYGTTRIAERQVLRADDHGAQVRLRLEYFPTAQPNDIVMEDTVDLVIEMPREDGTYRIDWHQVSHARRPIQHRSTPAPEGGYAGLSLRASAYLREVTLTASTGETNLGFHHKEAPWATLAGKINGQPAAVTFFDHPGNLRHPTPWFVVWREIHRKRANTPFWYLNAAFLDHELFTLQPDRPLSMSYRVRVDASAPAAASLAAEFREFAAGARPSARGAKDLE